MRKHEFEGRTSSAFAPEWIRYTCIHCGKVSGLNKDQIEKMPVSMAKCDKSPVRITLSERFWDNVNCLVTWKETPV